MNEIRRDSSDRDLRNESGDLVEKSWSAITHNSLTFIACRHDAIQQYNDIQRLTLTERSLVPGQMMVGIHVLRPHFRLSLLRLQVSKLFGFLQFFSRSRRHRSLV